jgi:hypothetical protein
MGCFGSRLQYSLKEVEGWLVYFAIAHHCDTPILEAVYFTCPNQLFRKQFIKKAEGFKGDRFNVILRNDSSAIVHFRNKDRRVVIGISPLIKDFHVFPALYFHENNITVRPKTRCFYTVEDGTMIGMWHNELSYSYQEATQHELRSPAECYIILQTLAGMHAEKQSVV